MFTAVWFVVGVACIPVAITVARRRERNPLTWGLLALVFGPLTLLVLLLLPGPRCPHCRRHLKPLAHVCGHCGRDVPSREHSWDRQQPVTYALGAATPPTPTRDPSGPTA